MTIVASKTASGLGEADARTHLLSLDRVSADRSLNVTGQRQPLSRDRAGKTQQRLKASYELYRLWQHCESFCP